MATGRLPGGTWVNNPNQLTICLPINGLASCPPQPLSQSNFGTFHSNLEMALLTIPWAPQLSFLVSLLLLHLLKPQHLQACYVPHQREDTSQCLSGITALSGFFLTHLGSVTLLFLTQRRLRSPPLASAILMLKAQSSDHHPHPLCWLHLFPLGTLKAPWVLTQGHITSSTQHSAGSWIPAQSAQGLNE